MEEFYYINNFFFSGCITKSALLFNILKIFL